MIRRIHNSNEMGLAAPPQMHTHSVAMAECGRCMHSMPDFMRESAVSCDTMLEVCFHHDLICRQRACTRCGQLTCLDLTRKSFRCDEVMMVSK